IPGSPSTHTRPPRPAATAPASSRSRATSATRPTNPPDPTRTGVAAPDTTPPTGTASHPTATGSHCPAAEALGLPERVGRVSLRDTPRDSVTGQRAGRATADR